MTKLAELRSRAVSQLGGHGEYEATSRSAPPAYVVLHRLASSPATAADALALLHEMQVHQVELELQADEMRASCDELEAMLLRQRQLYESAPVGHFTVDSDMAVVELNAAAAQMLGRCRDRVLGQRLHVFLTFDAARTLRALMRRVSEGHRVEACTLQLMLGDSESRRAHVTVGADPAGSRFLLGFMDAGAHC